MGSALKAYTLAASHWPAGRCAAVTVTARAYSCPRWFRSYGVGRMPDDRSGSSKAASEPRWRPASTAETTSVSARPPTSVTLVVKGDEKAVCRL